MVLSHVQKQVVAADTYGAAPVTFWVTTYYVLVFAAQFVKWDQLGFPCQCTFMAMTWCKGTQWGQKNSSPETNFYSSGACTKAFPWILNARTHPEGLLTSVTGYHWVRDVYGYKLRAPRLSCTNTASYTIKIRVTSSHHTLPSSDIKTASSKKYCFQVFPRLRCTKANNVWLSCQHYNWRRWWLTVQTCNEAVRRLTLLNIRR